MKLFQFAVNGVGFALPGRHVLQVLPPGSVARIERDAQGPFVEKDGRRLPVWDVPKASEGQGGEPRSSTFVRIDRSGGEALIRVDEVGGLINLPEGSLLPIPSYLLAGGQGLYRGLLLDGERLVGVLEPEELDRFQRYG